MRCPHCKNKGFHPTTDTPRPLINLGGKEHYDTFNTRRYLCVQCRKIFLTKEEFYRDVNAQSEPSLFDNAERQGAI